jgi:TRAP-type C4-dicarboxylate transport system permease large subunit
MDSLSMILLTIPIFFPIVMGLDFGLGPEETAIWFGILALIVVEVGLITPPVGHERVRDQRDGRTRRWVESLMPFLVSDLIRVVLLVTVPSISLRLVRLTY